MCLHKKWFTDRLWKKQDRHFPWLFKVFTFARVYEEKKCCSDWGDHLIVVGQFACLSDPLELCRWESCTPGSVTYAEQVKG